MSAIPSVPCDDCHTPIPWYIGSGLCEVCACFDQLYGIIPMLAGDRLDGLRARLAATLADVETRISQR